VWIPKAPKDGYLPRYPALEGLRALHVIEYLVLPRSPCQALAVPAQAFLTKQSKYKNFTVLLQTSFFLFFIKKSTEPATTISITFSFALGCQTLPCRGSGEEALTLLGSFRPVGRLNCRRWSGRVDFGSYIFSFVIYKILEEAVCESLNALRLDDSRLLL